MFVGVGVSVLVGDTPGVSVVVCVGVLVGVCVWVVVFVGVLVGVSVTVGVGVGVDVVVGVGVTQITPELLKVNPVFEYSSPTKTAQAQILTESP